MALRTAGLPDTLRAGGFDVMDTGDLPTRPYRPDPAHPTCQNLAAVLEVTRDTRDAVSTVVAGGRFPLVLGGDCTITLGALAGLLQHVPDAGLLYFDGDLDLNTPTTSVSGILDGMVLAHLTGRAPDEGFGQPRDIPLVPDQRVVAFGFDAGSGWGDPPELVVLEDSTIARFEVDAVRTDPVGVAQAALGAIQDRSRGFLLHFDVDVSSIASADVPHPGGLSLDAAFAALGVFLASPSCRGLAVTEFNAARDLDGSDARSLVKGIDSAMRVRF